MQGSLPMRLFHGFFQMANTRENKENPIGASVLRVKPSVQNKHKDNMYDTSREPAYLLSSEPQNGALPLIKSPAYTHRGKKCEQAGKHTRAPIIKSANLAKSLSYKVTQCRGRSSRGFYSGSAHDTFVERSISELS